MCVRADPIRVVLAEAHEVIRAGLRFLLETEPGLRVVAEAGEIESTRWKVAEHLPDALVLDLYMLGQPSLPVVPDFAAQTAVVIITMQTDPAFAREALRAGALGYVLKEAADAELAGAVRAAAAGRSYLSPRLEVRSPTPSKPARSEGTSGLARSALRSPPQGTGGIRPDDGSAR
jgi:two-component system response regulator NreC